MDYSETIVIESAEAGEADAEAAVAVAEAGADAAVEIATVNADAAVAIAETNKEAEAAGNERIRECLERVDRAVELAESLSAQLSQLQERLMIMEETISSIQAQQPPTPDPPSQSSAEPDAESEATLASPVEDTQPAQEPAPKRRKLLSWI